MLCFAMSGGDFLRGLLSEGEGGGGFVQGLMSLSHDKHANQSAATIAVFIGVGAQSTWEQDILPENTCMKN